MLDGLLSMTLRSEVNRFRGWAVSVQNAERTGEWETWYEHWNELYTAFHSFISTTSTAHWSDQDWADVIYALARDNEAEHLAEMLASDPDLLLAVSRRVLQSDEPDAKWQIAEQLSRRGHSEVGEAILLTLADNDHEYVSRRALMALGRIGSLQTEVLAIRAWETGQLYQRMAALYALKDVRSPLLDRYLDLAQSDGRDYLADNVRKIRESGS
jgi:hypothetical protein